MALCALAASTFRSATCVTYGMKQITNLILGLAILLSTVAPLTGAADVKDSSGVQSGQNVSQEVVTEAVENSAMLLQLKQKLAEAQYRYYLLQSNAEQAKSDIEDVNIVITQVEEVVADLEAKVKDSGKQIKNVRSEKEQKKMDVADLEEEIQVLELQYEDQKKAVADLMRLVYMKRGTYYDSNEVNAVKVLASADSVSETLQQITYLDLIEKENQAQIERMTKLHDKLAAKWDELRKKSGYLDILETDLTGDLGQLQEELAVQKQLLAETQGQKEILESMIAAADESEDSLKREVEAYQQNVEIMEAKFKNAYGDLSDEEKDLIARIEEDMQKNFGTNDASNFLDIDWPVSPSAGLTAFFIDPGYQTTFGVQHHALDIRAQQGTEIHAPADGVVNAVMFDENSTSYAYIRIAHRKGVMTVYGHVSGVEVQAGDYVTRGQLIGYTGGMPGSIGAGLRTTGPHLHIEVWQDGALVDPLKYLHLTDVPPQFLPEQYLEDLKSQLEDQIFSLNE